MLAPRPGCGVGVDETIPARRSVRQRTASRVAQHPVMPLDTLAPPHALDERCDDEA
jgi:hypothetical protein